MKQQEYENQIVLMLLNEKGRVFDILRKQYQKARIIKREMTGAGFITEYEIPTEIERVDISGRFDDIYAYFNDTSNNQYFMLHITKGVIDYLEGFSALGFWDEDYENAHLAYTDPQKRLYRNIVGFETQG